MRIMMLNGVGVVANKLRNILPGTEFDLYFPKPERTDPLLAADGTNDQTLETFIPQVVRQTLTDTAKIALVLKRETIEATVQAIWNFCYTYIQYKQDNPWQEEIRRPARSWADRKSGIDCDCYSVFISSILTNMRIPHTVRMAAYKHDRGFQHVYVVVPKKANSSLNQKGDYYTLDPVMDAFNAEKPFLFKKDKVMIPAAHNQSGLNGFPIRMLNGGEHVFAAKSELVHPQVYYSEGLKQWALKGIDGAYYLQANPSKRFIEPVEGLGFVMTALAAGSALWKNRKAIGKGLKSLKPKKGAIKEEAKNMALRAFPMPTPSDNGSQKAMQLNTMVSMDKMKGDLTQSVKASNYSTVMSINNLNQGQVQNFNSIFSKLEELKKSAGNTASLQELLQKAISITGGSQAQAQDLKDAQEEESKKNDSFRSKLTTTNMIIIAALIGLAIMIIILMVRKKV